MSSALHWTHALHWNQKKKKCKAASGKIWSYSFWNQHQIHVNVKYAHWYKEEHETKMNKWIVTFCTFNSPSQKTALVALCCRLGVPLSSMLTALSSQLLLLRPTVINLYHLRTDFSLREKQMNCLFYWCLLAVLSFVFLCLISRLQDLWGMDCWYTSFLCSDGSIVLLSKYDIFTFQKIVSQIDLLQHAAFLDPI